MPTPPNHPLVSARAMLALACALLAFVARDVAAQAPTDCAEIGLPATCHSCLHAVAGPFMNIGAQAHDASFIFAAVDQPHTYYRVALMASASVGPFAGAVSYYPNNDEPTEFAFYRAHAYTVRLFDDQGVELVPQSSFTISPETDCASIGYPPTFDCASLLPYADVFLLDAVQHTVRVEGATDATVGLVIENLASIGGTYYPDADNDGHGAYEPSLSTWCVPPAGYIDDSSDCNDESASVHDGATEICNGLDDDCDELVDEVDCAVADAGMDSEDAGSELPADASIDASHEDAATAEPDASIVVDAGALPDAAMDVDASTHDSGVDASVPDGKPSGGGCSCNLVASSATRTTPAALHVLGLLMLGAWRLRRRRGAERRA